MPTPVSDRSWLTNNPLFPIMAYLAAIGVLTVAAGGVAPDAVEAGTPSWLGIGWSLTMAAGGATTCAGGLAGRTRLESVGLALLLASMGLYVFAELLRHPDVEQVLALSALVSCILLRMRDLRLQRKALRVANALLGGRHAYH